MVRLLQVRVGGVRTVDGLTSAIFKAPVQGPLWLTREGLAGDQVADRQHHGGPDQAVLGGPLASYAAWAAEGHPFPEGATGENLLFDGLPETEVCIGDRFRIGEVELQVAHPRVPCGTLAKRLATAGILQRVWETGRGGYYLRVLREGYLEPGLEVTLLDRPHPAWNARRALHAQWKVAERPDEALALAALPELSAHWRERLPRQAKGPGGA